MTLTGLGNDKRGGDAITSLEFFENKQTFLDPFGH